MLWRVTRALTQRNIQVLDHVINDTGVEFQMSGSSGSVYRVTVGESGEVKCSCPDNRIRGQRCKHIYHLLVHRAGLTPASVDFFSSEPLTSETRLSLRSPRQHSESVQQVLALAEDELHIRNARMYNRAGAAAVRRPRKRRRREVPKPAVEAAPREIADGDVCAICILELKGEETASCPWCGHHQHRECIAQWNKIKAMCVLCKQPWLVT